ncbi:MAG: FAD-binding and (Fe-S)-binding domain-containing protein, partial [Calditrichia bacterium]
RLYEKIPQLLTKHENAIRNNYPKTWRNVAGYSLDRLLKSKEAGKPLNLAPLIVGSEGTLGAILSVKVNLVEKPTCSHLVLLHFDSLHRALSSVEQILEHRPGAVELLDDFFIGLTRQNAEYRNRLNFLRGKPAAVLIVEFSGEDKVLLQKQMHNLITALRRNGFKGEIVEQTAPEDIANVWQVRKAGLGLLLSKRGDAKPLAFIDDTAVPLNHLAEYADKVTEICQQAGTEAAFYAHASAGCLHINPMINLKTKRGIKQMQTISEEVIQLAIGYGGTSTGEHGEGLARSYYNKKVYGPELHRAFRELKGIFDPDNLFNLGKIVDAPLPWDSRILRFNPQYSTPQTIAETTLDFSAEGGFGGMVEMCNGQGFCRKVGSGMMCPSYMATGDEALSTRGRANALRATITGNLGKQGLENKSLYHTLDLCLACKACKHECPSLVDMAKLKYEYLAYYQKQHGVPFRSRLFAHISDFNRFGSKSPKIANALSGNKIVRRLLDTLLGIDRRRSLPGLTPETFRAWFSKHSPNKHASAGEVILWDDTFMTYNEPETGIAAVTVLEAAGYRVLALKNRQCCGRPMISKGLLEKAKQIAVHNINLLIPYAEKGIPIIGVEPGCTTMFRDEYIDLVKKEDARKVAENVFFVEEFLGGLAGNGRLNLPWKETFQPQNILVHGHCYQKATTGMESVLKMLQLIPGANIEEIDSGCCGMAGAFGYEKEHYPISMKCGEERLFPVVRAAGAATEIAAAGTSCRHQILDGTGRIAQHPIVLFARALTGE